jgi:hypothetical protein
MAEKKGANLFAPFYVNNLVLIAVSWICFSSPTQNLLLSSQS